MTEGMRSQLLKPFYSGNAQLSRQELLLAVIAASGRGPKAPVLPCRHHDAAVQSPPEP